MHCNLRSPEPRQSFYTLIATSCQICSHSTYPLPIIAFLLQIYISLYCDLDFWPLILNICSVLLVTWWNSVPNLNTMDISMIELLRFHCLTLWPWACVTCCARLWDNFHQLWPSITYPYENYNVFMLIRYVSLWSWPWNRSPWKFMVHQASSDQSLYEIWVKSSNPRLNNWWFCKFLHALCHAVSLTFDLLTLNFYSTSGVMRSNSLQNLSEMNNPRLSYWRFSTFSRAILGVGSRLTELSQGWVDPTSLNLVRT